MLEHPLEWMLRRDKSLLTTWTFVDPHLLKRPPLGVIGAVLSGTPGLLTPNAVFLLVLKFGEAVESLLTGFLAP